MPSLKSVRRYKHANVLNRLVVFFSLSVLIPLSIIQFFYYPNLTQVTKKFIDTEIHNSSEKAAAYMNGNLQDIFYISSTLNSQKYIWSGKAGKYSWTPYDLISSLTSQSTYLEKMFIHSGNSFLSGSGCISETYFGKDLFSLDSMEQEEFYDLLSGLTEPTVLAPSVLKPSHDPKAGNDGLPVVPVLIPSSDGRSTYVFFLSVNKIGYHLSGIISENFRYAIGNEENPFLFTNLEEASQGYTDEDLDALYTTSAVNLKYLDLSCKIFFDQESLHQELTRIHLLNIYFIILLSLIYIFTLLFFFKKSYQPVISLLDSLSTDFAQNKSEFDFISQAVRQLKSTNTSLSLKIHRYQADFKNTLIYQVLSDQISLMNNISDIEEWLEIPLNDRILYSGFIYFEKCESAASVWSYLEKISSVSYRSLDIAITPYFEKRCLFLLLSVLPEVTLSQVKVLLNDSVIKPNSSLAPIIVVSEPVSSIFDLHGKLSTEILSLNMLPELNFHMGVYSEEDILSNLGSDAKKTHDLILSLNSAMTDHDMEKVLKSTEEIKHFLASTPHENSYLLFSYVLYILFQNQIDPESEIDLIPQNITVQEMDQILDQSLKKIIHVEGKDLNDNSFEHIQKYINENYLSGDFSIKNIADKYHMQVSNMSASFKRKYGITFQEYVGQLKINKAKQLLSGNMDIEEIANLLNYSNSSSFGRAFKKATGTTPSEFRLLNRNGDKS